MYAFVLVILMSNGSYILQGFEDVNQCQYVQSYFKSRPYYHDRNGIKRVIATECMRERDA